MNLIENPLKRGSKKLKTMIRDRDGEATNEKTVEKEVDTKVELTKSIKVMAKIFYEQEYIKKEDPIYNFDEMRGLLQGVESSFKNFFDQLYLAA